MFLVEEELDYKTHHVFSLFITIDLEYHNIMFQEPVW